MGRIFIAAGYSESQGHMGLEPGALDSDPIFTSTTETVEMIALRDLLVAAVRSRVRTGDFEVLAIPDDLSVAQTTAWINARARPGDIALELHADAHANSNIRGASIFYISQNSDRRSHAELLLLALLRRVPRISSRGARPDTETRLGRLEFCRGVAVPSLYLNVGCLTNPDDRKLFMERRRDFALGLADGLSSWSRLVTPPLGSTARVDYPTININLNGGIYQEPGIIVNGNPCIPVDLGDRLGVDLAQQPGVRRIRYRRVVYAKALALREQNVSVKWNHSERTLYVRSSLPVYTNGLDQIMGRGVMSDVRLIMFLKANNEKAVEHFSELPKFYREEAVIEGVNHDIAFSQMCLETSFLAFGGEIQPDHNNFAGLGALGNLNLEEDTHVATFRSQRLGVRAHIQHLKAYASQEPLVQELTDPRFRFVSRGVAPHIQQLSGRWSANLDYGRQIISILKRLYESAGVM
ncbi:MAG: N-acetylmuramoyl-L-alanine amidase [Elainellaceae cyanobacterium]